MLHRCRSAFEELIMKYVELCQGLYKTSEAHNKKLSDNVGSLTKSLQISQSLKDVSKVIEGTVKDLQGISKYIKVGAMKEFKDVEDAIKKLKAQLK